MQYKIVSTNKFNKRGKRLLKNDDRLSLKLKGCLKLISENPQHPSLRLHKLYNSNYYSGVSLTMQIRILIKFEGDPNIFNGHRFSR